MTADPRDLKTILATPITAPVYTIDPMMEEGDRVITYAEWGSFKSLWAAHLGLALAAGISIGPFKVSKARRVLYIDEEMNSKRADRRIHRLCEGMGLDPNAVPHEIPFYLVNKTGYHFDLAGTINLLKLCDKAKLLAGDLVIYDSIRRGIVGSEKEVEDVSDMWQHIEQFKDLSFQGLHHMLKPRNQKARVTRHAASGSTDIMGGADQALSMVRASGSDYATIRHEKGRDGEAPDWRIHFDFGNSQTSPIVVSYAPVPVESTKPPQMFDLIAAHLNKVGPGVNLSTANLCGIVPNANPDYIKGDVIPDLIAAKLLMKVKHGFYKTPKTPKVEVEK